MKSSLLKWYMLVFLLASDFVMFAQLGDEEECPPGEECPDLECPDCDPEASINTRLLLLAILGISFALYYYKRHKASKILNS